MNSPKHIVTAITLFSLFGLLFSGCTLFDTREPEPPDAGPGAPFLQPDRPEIVLENLSNAFVAVNLQNYLRSINEKDFRYSPTVTAQNENPELWGTWSIEDEEAYFNNLSSASQSGTNHSLTFSDVDTEIVSSSVQQITATYNLTVNHNRNTQGVPTLAGGQVIFLMTAGEDGLWSISEWTDVSSSGTFSWSDLRAAFVRG